MYMVTLKKDHSELFGIVQKICIIIHTQFGNIYCILHSDDARVCFPPLLILS